jgi:hypothetical protein
LGEELAALLDLKRQSMRCWLYELHHLGCLEQVATEAGKRWHLCELGLRLLAAAKHLHIRNMASTLEEGPDMNSSPAVEHRGEVWLLLHIQHATGLRLLRQAGAGGQTTTSTETLLVGDGVDARTTVQGA